MGISSLRHILKAIVIVSSVMDSSGAVINVNSRNLSIELKRMSASEQEVVLEGEASDADLSLLRRMSDSVKVLDIRNLRLPGNTLPDYMLFNTGVQTLLLSEDTDSIGDWCFAESALREIVLPSSVKNIGQGAFYRCAGLVSADMSSCVMSECPDNLFYGCASLNNIRLPLGLKVIGNNAFRKSGLRSIDIEGVDKIGDFALAEMPHLESVILKNKVDAGRGLFYGDNYLSSIYGGIFDAEPLIITGTSVKDIAELYFGSRIGDGAFANLSVERLYINSDVREIGSNAFHNMKGLKEVNVEALKSDVPEIASDAFSGVSTEPIPLQVARHTADIWKSHPVWGNFMIKEPVETSVDDLNEGQTTDLKIDFNKGELTVIANYGIDLVCLYGDKGEIIGRFSPDTNIFCTTVYSDSPVIIVDVAAGNNRIIKKILNGKK